jgi:hypothetical protein
VIKKKTPSVQTMNMKTRGVMSLAVAALASVLLLRLAPGDVVWAAAPEVEAASPGPVQQTSTALVGRMYGVTMLKFRTDRALDEIRVVVDGETVGSLSVAAEDNQTTLKLASVVSGRRKSVSIFLDTINYSAEFTAAYMPMRDARDTMPQEYYGPGNDVKLADSGWVEVYRLSTLRHVGAEVTRFELKVEVR